ncbi:GDSL esterase/lipase-like protein [Drosera capensis]
MSFKMSGLMSLMIIFSMKAQIAASGCSTQPQVPCYFIFGDSLSDDGNNNWLVTSAKANYSPYGIDFKGGVSSGRFTNNITIADVISQHLGFAQYIPSFTSAVASPEVDISYGVNYASGGAGILNETGYQLGGRYSLDEQLKFFNVTKLKLLLFKGSETREYLSQCLYTLDIGSNDYINNYFAPEGYTSRTKYTPEQYATVLINQYSQQIQEIASPERNSPSGARGDWVAGTRPSHRLGIEELGGMRGLKSEPVVVVSTICSLWAWVVVGVTLYYSGARKIAVFALGYVGCAPAEILLYGASSDTGCVDRINSAVLLFNAELLELVNQLNQNPNLTDAEFLYVDVNNVPLTSAEGFTVFNQSCCRVTGSDGMCDKDVEPCTNRNEYIFYDNFHPTYAVNVRTGPEAYKQILPLIS